MIILYCLIKAVDNPGCDDRSLCGNGGVVSSRDKPALVPFLPPRISHEDIWV